MRLDPKLRDAKYTCKFGCMISQADAYDVARETINPKRDEIERKNAAKVLELKVGEELKLPSGAVWTRHV